MAGFEKHEIEKILEQDRMALAQSLAALKDRLRPANLVSEGKDALMAQASPLLSRLDGAVREHPLMSAVAGVALAGVIFGQRRSSGLEDATAVPAMAGTKFEALTRWEKSPAFGERRARHRCSCSIRQRVRQPTLAPWSRIASTARR